MREGPVERLAEVVALELDPLEPSDLFCPGEPEAGELGERDIEAGVTAPDRVGLAALLELARGVLMKRPEQPVAWLLARLRPITVLDDLHERAIDEHEQPLEHLAGAQHVV